MKKFKNWLIEKYLPAYARASAYAEISRLQKEVSTLKHILDEHDATIAALKYALKCGRLLEITLKGVDNYECILKCPEADKSNQ